MINRSWKFQGYSSIYMGMVKDLDRDSRYNRTTEKTAWKSATDWAENTDCKALKWNNETPIIDSSMIWNDSAASVSTSDWRERGDRWLNDGWYKQVTSAKACHI